MADTAPKPLKQHRGNCHCGAYVYEVKLPDPIAASECNCSVCVRKGYVWVRLTPESDFKVVKGDDGALTKYSKNNVFFHKFCTNCSTPLMASNDKEGSDNMTVLNVSGDQRNACLVDPAYSLTSVTLKIRAIQGPLDVWNMEKPV
ncbi:uncharacterized protein E0L32_010679 [Thyridium curvatum]|uniref:CENP-V/GFA domain-containing protein n=1 Tax=Thyridium curvatum TaxID=1093900 RepID=A0A507AS22_9PEZI|nr:uncharacterized protein E0L32_010679 [Thyridium curvatum]TPX07681.1 hypothetical protein E0L32_010679 [Thyridium curvatum]